MSTNVRPATVAISIAAAMVMWYFVFDFPYGLFWVKMAIATAILASISLVASPPRGRPRVRFRHVLIGVGSAAVLYGVFLLGKQILTWIIPGSAAMIHSVYATAHGIPRWVVALLLLLLTSPAEELYWRRFVQGYITRRWGGIAGLLGTTALYTLVHVITLNFALVVAAFTAGLTWGLIYYFRRTIVPTIISHALWAVTIFVLIPVM